MRDGLKVLQYPGRYGYAVTFIGFVKRRCGDEFDLLPGYRTVVQEGRYQANGLDKIASGDLKGYRLSDPAPQPQEIHRLLVRNSRVGNDRLLKVVPKPSGWVDDG